MTDAANGKTEFSPETAMRVGSDVAAAIVRQFGSGKSRDEFRLRMSNVGRPTCQLWFEKNKPEIFIKSVMNDIEGISKISTCKKIEKFANQS